jgi:hypothetical protein
MLEKLARDTHSSLLRKFVNYGQKSFITFGPVHHLHNFNLDKFTPELHEVLEQEYLRIKGDMTVEQLYEKIATK